jgi:hypothetical protein
MERCDSSNRLSATQTQFLLPTAAPRRTLAVAASTAFLLAAAALSTLSTPSRAVSGGGLDYANLDITGQDFSNGNYKGKDFTQGTCSEMKSLTIGCFSLCSKKVILR